ncbi:MAG: alpha-N-acetylglucosaminidase TIM-barrel domain-containing protein, partial [Planctomycetota bacterium]|nr:alpha-N-acetylglucosaminidase TIM-barrel domain-containing protein [Planctomycetota bacterium]
MHNGSGQANRFSSLAACALAAVVFCSCASADVAIVKQGKPLAKIVLGHKATGVEKHAAVELQKYIKQISGAALEIAGEDAAGAKGTFVLIGTPESSKLVSRLSDGLDIKSVKYDGFVIKEVAHGGASYLVLASPEARGCLYAVYDLLESALGVGFFWAGDRVPQAADVSITAAAQKVSSPYFEYREYLQGCAVQYSWVTYWDFRQWKKEIDWAAKHKFNILWYPSAGMLIEKRVYKRLGVDLGATTDGDRREADFIRQIINYARALGMKVVGPGFTGSVKAELKKVYPDAKYIEIQWLDLPPRLNLYPTDPLFKQLGQYLIEEYTREYGTDHLYDVGAYDETSPGKTRQEKQAIKVHFAKAVCEYIRTADPEGIWHMSGWTFQDPQ